MDRQQVGDDRQSECGDNDIRVHVVNAVKESKEGDSGQDREIGNAFAPDILFENMGKLL